MSTTCPWSGAGFDLSIYHLFIMKFQLPASLLLNAIKTSGVSHTMAQEGMNVALELGDSELLSSDATFAFVADKAAQTVTISSMGAATYALAQVPAMVEQDGIITINPKTMGIDEVLKSFGGYQVTVTLVTQGQNKSLRLYCGDIAQEVYFAGLGQPVTPSPRDMGETISEFRVSARVMIGCFEGLIPFAMPTNGPSQALKSVHVFQAGDKVGLVATDTLRAHTDSILPDYQNHDLPAEGITIYSGVVKAFLASTKLMSKDDMDNANAMITLGQDGRYFICLEYGSYKVCLQYSSLHGNYPVAATANKAKAVHAKSDYQIRSLSLKAFSESILPLAGLANASNIEAVILQIANSRIRCAVSNPSGVLMHSTCSATAVVGENPRYFACNIRHLAEFLKSASKAMGASDNVMLKMHFAEKPNLTLVISSPLSDLRHMIPGSFLSVDPSKLFQVAAPLRIKAEKDDKKRVVQLETEPVEDDAKKPTEAKKPRTIRKKAAKPTEN